MVQTEKNMMMKRMRKKPAVPPGKMGLPWIGETMEFHRAQKSNRLFEEFVRPRVAKHGKIFKTRIMGCPTVVVNSGPEVNRFLLSNEFKLVTSSWPSSAVELMGNQCIMAIKQAHAHRFLRSLIATCLAHQSSLETMVPKICETVRSHLHKYWDNKIIISLYRSTKILTFRIVFECLFGVKNVEAEKLQETFERVLEGVFALPFNIPGTKFWRAKKARQEIEKVLVNIVRERKKEILVSKEGKEDEDDQGMLLSRLVGGMIRGEISEQEVVDNIVLLVFAAHDTTSFAIAMIFRMLAHHPSTLSLVLQEQSGIMKSKKIVGENLTMEDTKKMRYTWQVAKESMRLYPPIFGSFRKAITNVEYDGFLIPKGWKILWTTYGTHYNEDHFQDPQVFDPRIFDEGKEMEPYVYLAFGGGTRICAGYQLAKLNILIFLHFVVTQYNWSLLYPQEPITMDPLPSPSFGMPISISPML
ncbi:Taxadiene 5-alpha-hydroxylase [Bertholletia excelsa]